LHFDFTTQFIEFIIEKNKDLLNATIELQEESEILVEEINTKEFQCKQLESDIADLNKRVKNEIMLKENAKENVADLREKLTRLQ
jgi:hypothetical protein